ncbi:MAG TPA: aminoacyl-tRNA hydrolase, partial [Anaeromyxobacteraceae bacterium]|nr:aminoacyl-tRNA hydrolase [Anaeromyxobacteraceae bacterium]
HSGEAVGSAMRFWKLDAADLVVVHDDLELDPFRVQVKVGGGHAGHNGLRSLNAHVGTAEYARVRIGVGRPPPQVDPADWVLGRFPRSEDRQVEDVVERGAAAARMVVEVGAARAMNEFNRRRTPAE